MDQSGPLIESELPDLTQLTLEDVRTCRRGWDWRAIEQRLLNEFGNPSVFAGDPKSSGAM
jgi:hypothetical protein